MDKKEQIPVIFYQQLGTLFYAIAGSDGTIRSEEFKLFLRIIKEESIFEKSGAQIIIDQFMNLQLTKAKSNDCFEVFKEFKKNNNSLFNTEIKYFVLQTADKIASCFASKNKSELILLAKLSIILKDIK